MTRTANAQMSKQATSATNNHVETILLTHGLVNSWKTPPFQRPVKINAKVNEAIEEIKVTQVVPGIITLGRLRERANIIYIVDGQHRKEAFLASGLKEAYVDARFMWFDSMHDMAKEFRRLNINMNKMVPDDHLRALEIDNEGLVHLRRACPFVGYDHVRFGPSPTKLSMSQALRCWYGSEPDAPRSAPNILDLADNAKLDDMKLLATFLDLTSKSWGFDEQYLRLWGSLNLTLCMWLYRRLVISPWSAKTKTITNELFSKALMSLSSDDYYLGWLVGRNHLSKRDRSPCFNRIKTNFAKRLEHETGKKPLLPNPPWLST